MSMTRREYVLVASAIRDSQLTEGGKARLVSNMIHVLKQNSHTFNEDKFIAVCYTDNSRTPLGNSIL